MYPFSLYKHCKYWIPPLISSELSFLDKAKNPVFEHAEAYYFMAYKQNKPVGRIATLINNLEIPNNPVLRFGWFDFEDDLEVSKTLINKAIQIGKEKGLAAIEGPLGFTSLDKVGVLSEGFDEMGSIHSQYHYPYYKDHFEKLGFHISNERLELKVKVSNVNSIEKIERLNQLVSQKYGVKLLEIKTIKDVLPYVDELFGVFNETYKHLHGFTPIVGRQVAFYKNNNINYLNPKYVYFLLDSSDKLIAFALLMPDLSKAMKKCNGKLFPFGIFRLLYAQRYHDTLNTLLVGVHPEYQSTGVGSLIYNQVIKDLIRNNIKNILISPIESTNHNSLLMWKNYKPEVYKKRVILKKQIENL